MTARGTAGHGSLPRDDDPVAHPARAVSRLAEAEQPVAFDETTRVFFQTVQQFPEYYWLPTVLSSLQSPDSVAVAARGLRRQDPELSAMLQTTVSCPTTPRCLGCREVPMRLSPEDTADSAAVM